MLITRPNHDLTTNYLFHWSKFIIELANKVKTSVIDLREKRANYTEFNLIVKKVRPNLIILNGHGNEASVGGYNDEIIVDAIKNPEILTGAIVYARSCKSAKKLGVESVNKGCKAYIGYDADFVFAVEDGMLTRPLMDKTAELFLNSSNKIAISLIKGKTVLEAYSKAKEILKNKIIQFSTSDASLEEKELIPALLWDYNHLVVIQNSDEN